MKVRSDKDIEYAIDNIKNKLIDISIIKSLAFSNGEGYVQHNIKTVNCATYECIKLAHSNGYLGDYDLEYVVRNIDAKNFRQNSIISKYLGSGIFYPFWYRLMCIDNFGREWGQVYFVRNPDKASSNENLNKYLRVEAINKLLE